MEYLENYLTQLRSDKASKEHLRNATISINQFIDFLGHSDFEKVTLNDINLFVVYLREEKEYAEGTINLRKRYIKSVFQHSDLDYIVKKMKIGQSKNWLDPDDILVPQDINQILEHENHPMYQALISVFWDTGARINEVLAVKKDKKGLEETDHGYQMKIYSKKTEEHTYAHRDLLLSESAPYVKEWLFNHNKPSDRLFPVHASAVRVRLSEIAEHLRTEHNFTKPINPHSFRHARATWLVKKKTNPTDIRLQMGWSMSSPMLDRYVTLAKSYVYESQVAALLGENNTTVPVIIQPEKNSYDILKEQIDYLIKERIEMAVTMSNMRGEIDHMKLKESEGEPYENPTTPTTNLSVSEIEESVKNFDINLKKAIAEEKNKHN